MSKTLLQLKVVNANSSERNIPAPRLCDLCANGAVLRGHARAPQSGCAEEVICLFLGRVIEIDVTECNRYVDRFPSPGNDPASAAIVAETAWVA